jgi:hypothetical protein
MSLSEPGKTRVRPNKNSSSSLHSPPGSPGGGGGGGGASSNNSRRQLKQKQQQQQQHERSNSDNAGKMSLSAESSSVTSLPGLRKAALGPSSECARIIIQGVPNVLDTIYFIYIVLVAEQILIFNLAVAFFPNDF